MGKLKADFIFIVIVVAIVIGVDKIYTAYNIAWDFELLLFAAAIITGLLFALDKFYFEPRRAPGVKPFAVLEFGRGTFVIFLVVFLLRGFIAEPFRIPSKSLAPSLWPGDFILVNKFTYGLRLPISHQLLATVNKPERGDIVVFRWPPNPSIYYVKRLIGVPGDHISYENKRLTINGEACEQHLVKGTLDDDENGRVWPVNMMWENLPEQSHLIYRRPQIPANNFHDIIVPEGYYFMMGDNRDASSDSRYWGFVPQDAIVGKAFFVWFSWDSQHWRIRWSSLGRIMGVADE